MNKEYKNWWIYEGSGMRPLPEEDMEEFAMRIAEIAWLNGAYKEREACLQIQEDWQYTYANDLVQKIRARGEA